MVQPRDGRGWLRTGFYEANPDPACRPQVVDALREADDGLDPSAPYEVGPASTDAPEPGQASLRDWPGPPE
jgi:hypothetical protein